MSKRVKLEKYILSEHFDKLPRDVQTDIVLNLQLKEIIKLRLVSSKFRKWIDNNVNLWRRLFYRNFKPFTLDATSTFVKDIFRETET